MYISKFYKSITKGMSNNLKYYILNGILFTLMASFSRSYAVKFLFRIGGTEHHASLFNALPGFVAIFATFSGIFWVNHAENKKKIIGSFILTSRIITLMFAFVPFFPTIYQPILFVILYSLMNFPEAASVTSLQSFSGDIFLPEERTNAISMKNKFSTLAQVGSFIVLGECLSLFNHSEKVIIYVYQLFFVLAFIIGLLEVRNFYKLSETSCYVPQNPIKIKTLLKNALKNRKFCIFMSCSLLFHFGWQMGWPLFSIYQINYLGADEGWLTILNISSNIIMIISFNYWNKLIKTKGNSFATAVSTLGMAVTPALYAVTPNLYIMTITGIVTGFFTAGTLTVILSSLLEVAPENERIVYVGIHSTLTNISLAIAPLVGDVILNSSSIYIALLATAAFRLLGSISFFIRNKFVS